MLWIHPIVAVLALLTGLYALRLGVNRILSLHFSRKAVFQRKRHVAFGRLAVVLWSLALLGGFAVVRLQWGSAFITGTHASGALMIAPFLVVSAASGIYMERKMAARKLLPLFHGVCNMALIVMAMLQGVSGWGLVQGLLLK